MGVTLPLRLWVESRLASQFWWLLAILDLWVHHSNLCFCHQWPSSPRVSVFTRGFPSSLKVSGHIGLGPTLMTSS